MSTVIHQADNNRFVLSKDEKECLLEYTLVGAEGFKKIDFTHTYVPFSLRGQGLAEPLVEAGLSWAKNQGYEIEASCWYVKKMLQK